MDDQIKRTLVAKCPRVGIMYNLIEGAVDRSGYEMTERQGDENTTTLSVYRPGLVTNLLFFKRRVTDDQPVVDISYTGSGETPIREADIRVMIRDEELAEELYDQISV